MPPENDTNMTDAQSEAMFNSFAAEQDSKDPAEAGSTQEAAAGQNSADQARPEANASGEPAPAKAGADDDPWKDAPHLRELYEKANRDWEYKYRSMGGRFGAVSKQLEQLKQQPAPQAQQQEQPQPAANALLEGDEFKAFRDEYPDIAAPIAGVIESLQNKIAAMEGNVGAVTEHTATAIYEANASRLMEAHPDFVNMVQDARFYGWLETQPASVQQAAQRNWDNIVDPADAAVVFDRFKAQVYGGTSTAAPQPKQPDPRRAAQLNEGKDVVTKQPVATSDEGDTEALWNNFAAKFDKQRASAI